MPNLWYNIVADGSGFGLHGLIIKAKKEDF